MHIYMIGPILSERGLIYYYLHGNRVLVNKNKNKGRCVKLVGIYMSKKSGGAEDIREKKQFLAATIKITSE